MKIAGFLTELHNVTVQLHKSCPGLLQSFFSCEVHIIMYNLFDFEANYSTMSHTSG